MVRTIEKELVEIAKLSNIPLTNVLKINSEFCKKKIKRKIERNTYNSIIYDISVDLEALECTHRYFRRYYAK